MKEAILSVVRIVGARWHHSDDVGKFVASGGAGATGDLQKAQVFGFSAKARKTLRDRYGSFPEYYEVVPVMIGVVA